MGGAGGVAIVNGGDLTSTTEVTQNSFKDHRQTQCHDNLQTSDSSNETRNGSTKKQLISVSGD